VKSISFDGFSLRGLVWTPLLLLALCGCGREDVQVYRVGKEEPRAASAQPAGQANEDAPPQLEFKAPIGWEEVAPGQMRVASFRINGKEGKQADVSVVPLPGLAGSDLDNVNRWRGQVGLAPVTEQELAKLAEPLEIAGEKAQLYDQAGQVPGSGDKARILAALTRKDGVAWFFKMTGDDELVAQQKPSFIEFLKSVRFGSPAAANPMGLPPSHPPINGTGAAPAGMDQFQLPPSHPPIGGAAMTAAGSNTAASVVEPAKGRPQWQAPSGWQEAPAGQFLVAKFIIGDARNAVNVSMSEGNGGGLSANVNRWRGQLGLASLADAELAAQCKPLEVTGGTATLVDMTGTDARSGGKARLVAAIVTQGNQTWFYKLLGSEEVVSAQKDAFTRFVQSARY
jgi:hypothetical protein